MAELSIGDQAPGFELEDTEGTTHSLADGDRSRPPSSSPATTAPTRSPGTTASWTSPRDYEPQGVRVLLISPNDAERYPRDSYEAMQQRVRDDGGWPAPYLTTSPRRSRAPTEPRRRRTSSSSTPTESCATAAPPTPTTTTRVENAEWLRGALEAVLNGATRARRDGPGRLQHQVEIARPSALL